MKLIISSVLILTLFSIEFSFGNPLTATTEHALLNTTAIEQCESSTTSGPVVKIKIVDEGTLGEFLNSVRNEHVSNTENVNSLPKNGNELRREKREPKKRKWNASVDVEHRRRQGTDVNAQVGGEIWKSRNGQSELNGNANYNQHFGGPGGRSKPNYGAGLQFRHRF